MSPASAETANVDVTILYNTYRVPGWRWSNCVTVPNFAAIGQTVAEIWQFSIFARWRPSAIFDLLCLLCACSDHPQRAFVVLIAVQKTGWNRCSSFDNMHVFSISRVWLENAYSRPQNWVWGIWPLKWGAISTKPKRHILAQVRIVLVIMRENPSTGLTCRRVPKKGLCAPDVAQL